MSTALRGHASAFLFFAKSFKEEGASNLSWTMEALDKGVIEPPRRVLRLYPKADREEIQQALAGLGR